MKINCGEHSVDSCATASPPAPSTPGTRLTAAATCTPPALSPPPPPPAPTAPPGGHSQTARETGETEGTEGMWAATSRTRYCKDFPQKHAVMIKKYFLSFNLGGEEGGGEDIWCTGFRFGFE